MAGQPWDVNFLSRQCTIRSCRYTETPYLEGKTLALAQVFAQGGWNSTAALNNIVRCT